MPIKIYEPNSDAFAGRKVTGLNDDYFAYAQRFINPEDNEEEIAKIHRSLLLNLATSECHHIAEFAIGRFCLLYTSDAADE